VRVILNPSENRGVPQVNRKNVRQRLLLLAGLLALLAAVSAASVRWYYRLEHLIAQDVTLLTMTSDGGAVTLSSRWDVALATTIHYTTDGSVPDAGSAVYTGPIPLPQGQRTGLCVRAVVCQGERCSAVFTGTFFAAASAQGTGIYTVCLTGDPDDFYSAETGILALGADTQAAADADESLPQSSDGLSRGNYYGRGAEWERAVNVAVYDADGALLLQQDAGVRVTGGATRAQAQKSLRLYARKSYDADAGTFALPIFGQAEADGSGAAVEEYNHLDLRSGGNDWAYTMLDDALMRRLAADSGLAPAGTAVPAAVYLNGSFYGFAWLQPDYSAGDLAEMCGLTDKTQVEIVEGQEGSVGSEAAGAAEDYDAMYALALQDLTVPANAAALEKELDVDNCLLYYALELYSNNDDWPANNYKLWRDADASGADAGNPYADGRWRFLFYDLDHAFNTFADTEDNFDRLLNGAYSPMLVSLLRNADYRARFVNLFCDLLGTSLSADRADAAFAALRGTIEPEMVWRETQDPDTFDAAYRQILLTKIGSFLESRPEECRDELEEQCGAAGRYTLTVDGDFSGAEITLNHLTLAAGEGLTADYYRSAPVQLSCTAAAGWRFAAWEVNGVRYDTPSLTLTQAVIGTEGAVTVRLLMEQTASGPLLDAVCYQGLGRWVELANPGNVPADLTGCTLTDDTDKNNRYALPALTLAPGETLRIYCKKDETSSLGDYQCSLSLREGRTLSLLAADGTVLDTVTLPERIEGYWYRREIAGWQYEPAGEEGT
jgi:hypothetical protein